MLLEKIYRFYNENLTEVEKQAETVTKGVRTMAEIHGYETGDDMNPRVLDQVFDRWQLLLDYEWGGERRAPKFPLPIGFKFLLAYNRVKENHDKPKSSEFHTQKSIEAVKITLEKMALGGIYDQLGGGFARYSTDIYWKVPHFEKMLYDNSQLLSLYSNAYRSTQDPLYKSVVYETIEFLERELTSPLFEGGTCGFYSSLDADSEGEEGKFYLWTKDQLEELLGDDAPLVMDYFNVTKAGNWEDGKNILFRTHPGGGLSMSRQVLQEKIRTAKKKMLEARSKRVRPALDDKILTSWNALMINGLVDAYLAFDEESFLRLALENAGFFISKMMKPGGGLYRVYKNGRSSVDGFMDDYAFLIQAFISLYRATFDEEWLMNAEKLVKYTMDHFFNPMSGLFYYTSDQAPPLIARKMEIADNTIPASNSQMALNLFILGKYFSNDDYIQKARAMLHYVKNELVKGGPYYANWSLLMSYFVYPFSEVVIVGEECIALRKEFDRLYIPNFILAGAKTKSSLHLPITEEKSYSGQTMIYVCRDKTCFKPVTDVSEALKQILAPISAQHV